MSIRPSLVIRFISILVLLPIYTTVSSGRALADSDPVDVPFTDQKTNRQGSLFLREPRTKVSKRVTLPLNGAQVPDEGDSTSTPASCTDPVTCNPISAITSVWRCNIAACTSHDWVGAVISWPSWSAYSYNARTGDNSRTVYSLAGQELYPYMGAWADGCQVTVVSGTVLIIEWQRGTDTWRGTQLFPGNSYTIDLVDPEDNAMIEAPDGHREFSVSLSNCNPQDIYVQPSDTPSATVSPTPTVTASPTQTATPSPTKTFTPTKTNTPTNTPTSTKTATATATFTRTPTRTPNSTATFTSTPTATWTATASKTPTATYTHTPTITPSATATHTLTATPTSIVTNTATAIPTATFRDVKMNYWAWSYIERLYRAGITSGCGGGNFCPTAKVTRDQMSVFMLKAKYGSGYLPPKAVGVFADVPANYWAAPWIEQAAKEGIILACKASSRMFCPTTAVTRDYMALFLLKAKYGSNYLPPKATGVFTDVSVSYWAAPWIEQLAADGITSGCSVTPRKYCPSSTVTRDQMSVFLVKNFNLP